MAPMAPIPIPEPLFSSIPADTGTARIGPRQTRRPQDEELKLLDEPQVERTVTVRAVTGA